MGEDRFVEVVQLGSWLDAELLDEDLARVAIGLQRIGLAAAAVQREHQLRVQPLAPRMLRPELSELGDQLAVASHRKVGLDAHLQRRQALLLKPRDLGRRERRGSDLGERRPAPQLQRRTQRRGSVVATSGRERLAAVSDQTLEALSVELAGAHAQPVAGRRSYQHLRVVERLS